MKELNKKIAEWLGWEFHSDGVHWRMSSDVLGWSLLENLPDFTISLDACFEYIVPKLNYWLMSQEGDGQIGIAVQIGVRSSGLVFAKTPALALCRAVEKLIDEST